MEGLGHDLQTPELEVAPRAGADVDERAMCAFERRVEKLHVQLLEGGPFVPVWAGQSAIIRCPLHRALSLLRLYKVRVAGAQELSTQNLLVELNVVCDYSIFHLT